METAQSTAAVVTAATTDLLEILTPKNSGTVCASAGTGKTWLLVSRILRLLLAGHAPASILAITFTNKAADEMRERLMARLLQWSSAGTDELRASLREIGVRDVGAGRAATRLYETLLYTTESPQITTFHAFCQQILRLFPLHTEAPLNFQLAESLEGLLRARAVDALFIETTRDGHRDAARALDVLFDLCNGVENARTALESFLTHANDWRAHMQGGGEKPEPADGDAGVAVLEEFWRADSRERIAQYAERIAKHRTRTNLRKAGRLRMLTTRETLDREAFRELKKCFLKGNGEPLSAPGGQPLRAALGEKDALRLAAEHRALAAKISVISNHLLQRDNERLNAAWHCAGERLCAIYTDLKRENNLLDFNDLEWMGAQLLRGEHDPQERLGNRIDHVLIDEFQDTNPSQWQFLKPLLEEIVSRETGSLFIVGDVKQSIYGFRRADPELQQVAADWLRQRRPDSLHMTMDTSRRAARDVIHFVNRVFGERDEEKNAAVPAGFAPHDTLCESQGGVRVFALHPPKEVAEQHWRNPLQAPRTASQSAPEDEAEQIAKTILRLRENRLPIEEDGRRRGFQWRDAMILARQTTHFPAFLQALRKAGIPSISAREQSFLTSLEAADLIALLEFLQNPYRDDALAQVLRSPMYSLTDEQLLTIARAPGNCWRDRLTGLGEAEDDAP